MSNLRVHLAHCCPKYGCKYGDETCPVENGSHHPYFKCEHCTCLEMNPEAIQEAIQWWSTLSDKMKAEIYLENKNQEVNTLSTRE